MVAQTHTHFKDQTCYPQPCSEIGITAKQVNEEFDYFDAAFLEGNEFVEDYLYSDDINELEAHCQELDFLELQNQLLARQIELLEQVQTYSYYPIDVNELFGQ